MLLEVVPSTPPPEYAPYVPRPKSLFPRPDFGAPCHAPLPTLAHSVSSVGVSACPYTAHPPPHTPPISSARARVHAFREVRLKRCREIPPCQYPSIPLASLSHTRPPTHPSPRFINEICPINVSVVSITRTHNFCLVCVADGKYLGYQDRYHQAPMSWGCWVPSAGIAMRTDCLEFREWQEALRQAMCAELDEVFTVLTFGDPHEHAKENAVFMKDQA